jgi:hypothetical protein
MKKQLFLLLVISILSFTDGYSQTTTSKIHGVISDDASTGLFGANVIATHVPTGTVAGTMTLEGGRFTLTNLRVGGPYTITISYVGFQTMEYTDVYLDLGKGFDLNAKMVPDSELLNEVVITGGKNSTFNNDRTGAETSVGQRELTTLPSISRSASDFYRLEPTSSGGSFGGRNDQFNNFSLDGSIFNNPFGLDAATPGGQSSAQPVSLDAIEQIQVSTAPYDVTQAGFTGAAVNAVTKSGTNEFHGTAFAYYRNQDLTGSKVGGEDIFVPKLDQTQFGASIGGPIVKNKLFFFANFESDDRTDLGSNFIASRPNVTGSNVSNVLASDLDNVSSLLSGIGYETGAYENYLHNTKSTKGIFKLDWNINQNHRLALIYNYLDAYKDNTAHPNAIAPRGPDLNILQFENSGYRINNKIQSYLAELNSNFGEKFTNKLQIGYTHFDDFRDPFSAPAPVINIHDGAGSPYIVAGHEPFSVNNKLDQQVFQVTNNLNVYLGDHTLTLGTSYEKFMFDNSFNLVAYGFGIFGSYPSVAAFGAAVGDGTVSNDIAAAQATYDAGNWALAETNVGQWSVYGQDEWNMSDDFKLTYGLRIDKPLYFNTSTKILNSIASAYWYDETIPYFDGDGNATTLSSSKLPSSDALFSPRVGFNWDVLGNSSLQFRGGTGIFTGRLPFVWIGNQVANVNADFYTSTADNFKFPQVWKTSFGADYKFEDGLVATADFSYSKDINGMMVRNYSLNKPTGVLDGGADTRAIYLSSDRNGINQPWGQPINSYIFTNTDKGHQFNMSYKLQKRWDNNLNASIAYNYLVSKDANSIEAEITSDAYDRNPTIGNVNIPNESNSLYGDKHRIVGAASKNWTYGQSDKWNTTISAFYEYAQGGRFSYTYSGDINNDGSSLNDLIYIPTSSEVTAMNFSGGASQASAFESFIQQDDYLSANRGSYMEKYAALSPWRGRWDVKFLQDLKLNVGNDKTNHIQFSIDVLNLGNLLNSDWGVVQYPTNRQPIAVSVDPVTKVPTYSFNESQTRTFTNDFSLLSRWQMQFGLRYIF